MEKWLDTAMLAVIHRGQAEARRLKAQGVPLETIKRILAKQLGMKWDAASQSYILDAPTSGNAPNVPRQPGQK